MNDISGKVVTRMAPSPTGHLHIGTARTALFNFLYAKKHNGTFLLRSEDTDRERSSAEFEAEILSGLAWLGLEWDELYRQSERGDIYRGYLMQLVENGTAYVSREESRREPGTEIEVIRLKNPNKVVTFDDEVRGEISFDTTELGDFVIARSYDDALYHFAVVVDDHEMGVTHVIRGEDHLSNTSRQILIQEAIDAARPVYAHLPLLLAPDRSKLSKRHGAVALNEYQAQGYLSSAIANYLALLGWNPGTNQEIFMLDELIQEFDLGGVQKGGAVFNVAKLNWFNREHILAAGDSFLAEYVRTWIVPSVKDKSQYSEVRLRKLLPIIQDRVEVGSLLKEEVGQGEYDFAFESPQIEREMLRWKNDNSFKDALPRLQKAAELISALPDESSVEEIKAALWDYAEQEGKGEVLWPLRVALTGKERSPDPFTVIHIIGTAEAHKRVQHACDTILSA